MSASRSIATITPATGVVVLHAGDDGWDAARATFNVSFDQRPAAIALPRDAGEVADAVAIAAEHGLRVAPQRTGHNAGPLGDLSQTMLLRTDGLRGVTIDAPGRRARALAGDRWEDVIGAASALGLATLHGSTPDVSIAGYTLGGGMGWYARRYGLASNHVLAIEVVTADGRQRRVDDIHEPELFWALRGGGGNFGVVTAMEFELFDVAELYAGALFFPWERSSEVLHAWHRWVADVPDEITSVGRILQFPPLPEIPEPLRGNAFVLVEAAYLGDEARGAALLEPLRALGPQLDTFAMVPPAGLAELHMDPRDPLPYAGGHRLLGDLPPEAIDALVALSGPDSGSPMTSLELRHMGGALARREDGQGALAALDGSFALFAVGIAPDAQAAAALHEHLARVVDAVAPYDVGRYLNFTEEATDAGCFFAPDTLSRLQAVKAAVDPDARFHANHPIAPR